MTAQVNDSVEFEGDSFDIMSEEGSGLFYPEAYHITTEAQDSACWRGYYCRYKVTESKLYLDFLNINPVVTALNKKRDNIRARIINPETNPEETTSNSMFPKWPETESEPFINPADTTPKKISIYNKLPKINNIKALYQNGPAGDWSYKDINLPIMLTGKLHIAKDFVWPRGYFSKDIRHYKTIVDLVFEKGHLIDKIINKKP